MGVLAYLVWKPWRTFEAGQFRRTSAGNAHLKDMIDDGIIVVAQPRDRAKTLNIDFAVVANSIIPDVDALDFGEYNIHGALRAVPRQAVRTEIAALEMDR